MVQGLLHVPPCLEKDGSAAHPCQIPASIKKESPDTSRAFQMN